MNVAVNSLAWDALSLMRGRVRWLNTLENPCLPVVEPAALFPRTGIVRWSGAKLMQQSQITCGTTVLAAVHGMFDARALAYLQARDIHHDRALRTTTATHRQRSVQDHLLTKVSGGCWPRSLGTPPWGLARCMPVPGVAYSHLPLNDRDHALGETMTQLWQNAAEAGIPIPLYVGGSVTDGLDKAVARHVVLLIPHQAMRRPPTPGYAYIYEPGSGRVFRRRWQQLWNRNRPDSAFGGWTHLSWAVIPNKPRASYRMENHAPKHGA